MKWKKIFFTPTSPDYMIMFFRVIALVLVVVTFSIAIITVLENDLFFRGLETFIAPLGILISALLASFSVVYSVDINEPVDLIMINPIFRLTI